MLNMGVTPDTASLTMAASACERTWNSKAGLEVMKVMQSEGVVPDMCIYNALIGAFGRANDGIQVCSLFRKMLEDPNPAVKPNLQSYGSLISSCKREVDAIFALSMFLHYATQNANDQSPKYLEVVPLFLFENALLLCWQWSQADTAWKIWQLYTTSVAHPPTTLMCEYTLLSLAHDEHSGNLDTVLSTMIQQVGGHFKLKFL
eukprot:GHVN01002190.1.p1 GENE.GHVN01002190.1~~GHVN01002190.1.p1  ORF type:complete len:203 (-),score=15.86 GHVN01002190.1:826-1434(-)